MKRIYVAGHLPDAFLLLHILETAGIDAKVFNQNLLGGVGDLPHVYPEVWIEEDQDLQRALQLVDEFENNVTPDGVIRCNQCDEDNPTSFDFCWQCGHNLSKTESVNGSTQEKKNP